MSDKTEEAEMAERVNGGGGGPLDLKAAEGFIAQLGRTHPGAPGELFALREIAAWAPALVAEVKRLRQGLANVRDIEEYVKGRPCTCSGVGCVQCVARLTLEGREKELFS